MDGWMDGLSVCLSAWPVLSSPVPSCLSAARLYAEIGSYRHQRAHEHEKYNGSVHHVSSHDCSGEVLFQALPAQEHEHLVRRKLNPASH